MLKDMTMRMVNMVVSWDMMTSSRRDDELEDMMLC